MAAATALGGFSGPEADTLGYAIRKKKSSVLRSMKDQFVTQAAERGVRPETIDAVFKAFEPFERYGFNKAHATTYGLVAYQTAYLKANYTVEYMTSVLTAFRDKEEKVAAAVAECRRLGIEVLPPDVHASHLEFTVEGEAIRFGLLAVKNVGQGAIDSIIAAREAGGPFRSFADFCGRVDLRLVNKRVLESLIKVGALNAFGHPAQLLLALDDVLAAAQADQRERASGQISFFDLAPQPGALEAPLPDATEVPVRERLRWEKELLGLYLSDHPLGEVVERIGKFVTAYSGDLKDETLDGQRIVVGGVVTGVRTVVTKARATMAVVTLEDLQGSIEVVVFPRLYEQTAPTWQEGAILLVAGRIDHRGEDVSLLADLVRDFDAASADGEEAFAAEVAAADRGRPRGRGANGNGNGSGNGNGRGAGAIGRPEGAARRGPAPGAPANSPIRPDSAAPGPAPRPAPAPSAPVPAPGAMEPDDLAAVDPDREEAPFPDEAREAVAAGAAAPTLPREAGPDGRLHVRFAAGLPADELQAAMAAIRDLFRERPGATRVTVHLPQGPGRPALPMELRSGVAYDAELAAEVARRLRPGVVEVDLAGDGQVDGATA
jgi:DNA polymerase-3 subunit alpha